MNTIELYNTLIEDQKQVDREVTMVLQGYEKTFQAVDDGKESYLAPVLSFVNDLTKDFSKKIGIALNEDVGRKRSLLSKATDYMAIDQISYITCKTFINAMFERRKRNSLGKQLSGIIVRNLDFSIASSKKITQEDKDELLKTTSKYSLVGFRLLMIFIESYPEYIQQTLVHTQKTINNKISPESTLEPTEEWTAKMDKNIELYAFTNHSNNPMIRPPMPWNYNGYGGGYYSEELRVPIHKVHANKSKEDRHCSSASEEVIDAVNKIQATPWKVNIDVLDVLTKLSYDPPSSLKNVFPKQPDILDKLKIEWTDKEDFLKLPADERRKLRNHQDKIKHTRNRLSAKKSVDISTVSSIRQAKEYMNDSKVYFPYSIDYRGRIYSLAMSGLNPQGSDLSKGLLMLANGKEIRTADGIQWYKVNLANLLGYDKLTIDDKIAKVDSMTDELRLIASDPINYAHWHDWEKPIQGLGACLEYVQWLDNPTMEVHTHVQLDGTCNGVQHLTALSKDADIAPHVGLTQTKKKGDIYQYVCDGVMDEIDRIIRAGKAHDYYTMAKLWKSSGLINRKLTKKPVMTRSYSATLFGIKDGVKETILDSHREEHFIELVPSANFMGQIIWEVMDKELYGAMAVMEWFKAVAKAIAKNQEPLTWSTPSGMVCYYAPRKMKQKRYKIKYNRVATMFCTLEATEVIDGKKLASSIAPNIIHSFDASHLVLTANEAYDNGITDFAFVHDSYGTHPDDAQKLLDITKGTFARIYSQDYLQIMEDEFNVIYPDAEIPKVSDFVNYGDYNVSSVMKSDYFFG